MPQHAPPTCAQAHTLAVFVDVVQNECTEHSQPLLPIKFLILHLEMVGTLRVRRGACQRTWRLLLLRRPQLRPGTTVPRRARQRSRAPRQSRRPRLPGPMG